MPRYDGKKVKKIDATHRIMPYLMKNRCDAEVFSTEIIDITELLKYLDKINKGKEKANKVTLFHAVITALSMTIYNRPLLNRFVAGRKYYDRNEISFGFVAKNKLVDDAEERLIIERINNNMNLFDISNDILSKVNKTRINKSNEMNDLLDYVTMFPRCITSLIMNAFRLLDFYGLVPKSISSTDPNYSTVLISNLGSIKANSCYHHLNNYGTNSIVCTIGVIKEENNKKIVDFGFTLDERIADGVYFSNSIKLFKHILENPILLENNINNQIKLDTKKS